MAAPPPIDPRRGVATNPYPWYAARPWVGMRFGAWLGLLRCNGFRVSARRVPVLLLSITLATWFNSIWALVQERLYGPRIAATVVRAPIFVVGHWRSGTTLLHELLVLDERFAFADSSDCFVPNDSLVTRRWMTRLSFLLPSRRPMDDMAVGWDRPQEDEWALCNMGLPSPYLSIAFPNEPPMDLDYLDLDSVDAAARGRWQQGFRRWLQTVTLRTGRPLVLKSPTHTGRLAAIREVVPDARFVHIVREPRAVYQSSVRLWQALETHLALQEPAFDGLEEFVLSNFERMYGAFERQRPLIGDGDFFELRYEDLVADPVGQIRRLYDGLGLDGFDTVAPRIRAYFAEREDYHARTYPPDAALDAVLAARWGRYLRRFGYLS